MKKSNNILKHCFNCSISISILSVLFFTLFMSYAASLNTGKSDSEKRVSSNSENIQDEYNYEFYTHSGKGQPFHTLRVDKNNLLYITLDDPDKNFNRYSKLTKLVFDDHFAKTDFNNSARKYFILQVILKTEIPTEISLRSDVLLI